MYLASPSFGYVEPLRFRRLRSLVALIAMSIMATGCTPNDYGWENRMTVQTAEKRAQKPSEQHSSSLENLVELRGQRGWNVMIKADGSFGFSSLWTPRAHKR